MMHDSDTEPSSTAAESPITDQHGGGIGGYRDASGRDVAALLNPRPVALIGAHTSDPTKTLRTPTDSSSGISAKNPPGETCFATVAWITPVSHEPAMVAFSLRARSRTMELLNTEGFFGVCTLPANTEGVALAELCGNLSSHHEHKGALVPHTLMPLDCAPSRKAAGEAVPLIPIAHAALSWLACSVDHVEDVGDHLLVIGAVLVARTQCERDEKGRIAAIESLLCIQHDAFACGSPL